MERHCEYDSKILKRSLDYVKRAHHDIVKENLREDLGLDIDKRSNALRDVIWSVAVQHGPKK